MHSNVIPDLIGNLYKLSYRFHVPTSPSFDGRGKHGMISILFLITLALSLSPFVSPPPVFAQPLSWDQINTNCYYDDPVSGTKIATLQGLECIFSNVSRIIIPFAGLAMFIMLIVGALQLLTSAGDPKQTQKASKTITFAIVGIVVIVSIWFILKLIQTITGVDVTKFAIPK